MATSEFLAWGVPMVLVPLPTAAADHQTQNARTLEGAGAAVCLLEKGLEGAALWEAILELFEDPRGLAERRRAALERARPQAALRIAEALAEFLSSPRGGPS
jgi:UDP-N-acetylglucosamine--N-acetylmuramyl-(pentapeptide) pyrophosphoryl-undecaprenol N-acetylglucosamine transferase